MEKILCKKTFIYDGGAFMKDGVYDYWTNFGGLNHIVSGGTDNTFPFKGGIEDDDDRPYIFDFFYTKEEMRDVVIDKVT